MSQEPFHNVHIHIIIASELKTLCGSQDTHELISVNHYINHVSVEDCCRGLRERMCSYCVDKVEGR